MPTRSTTRTVKPSVKTAAKQPRAKKANGVSAEERRRLIAEAAYFKAERRGFPEDGALEDWVEAEAEIDALLDARQSR
ncbi:MAG: DUF2934 domain-containing protein [Rhodocyclales bacterium]|jgi:hypothetical protein|nr:DUF2934 domain-containing protein [Rhodocyclales bacterium]